MNEQEVLIEDKMRARKRRRNWMRVKRKDQRLIGAVSSASDEATSVNDRRRVVGWRVKRNHSKSAWWVKGNARKLYKNSSLAKTRQEIEAELSFHEQIQEMALG